MQQIAQSPVSHDGIARRAYELWNQRGRPEGLDVDFWLEAEREIWSAIHTSQPDRGESKAPLPPELALEVVRKQTPHDLVRWANQPKASPVRSGRRAVSVIRG